MIKENKISFLSSLSVHCNKVRETKVVGANQEKSKQIEET